MSGNVYIHRNITPGSLEHSIPDILTSIWFDIENIPGTAAQDLEIYRMVLYEVEGNFISNLIVDYEFSDQWEFEYTDFEQELLDSGFEILWNDDVVSAYIEL